MFSTNLRSHNFSRLIVERYLRLLSKSALKKRTNLNEQELIESTDFKFEKLIQSTVLNSVHQNLKSSSIDQNAKSIDQLIEKVNKSETIEILLNLIEPHISKLDSYQLEATYIRLINLFTELKVNLNISFKEFKSLLHSSIVFKSLLDHANQSIDALHTNCLITQLRLFNLIAQDLESPVFKNTCNELNKRSNSLELNQIIECLFIMQYYLDGSLFNKQFFEQATRRILANELNLKDINTIIKCFLIFLRPEYDSDFKVIKKLTFNLLSDDIQLNFKQSIDLLRKIKQAHFMYSDERLRRTIDFDDEIEIRRSNSSLFPKTLTVLIDKCNAKIYSTLAHNAATDENFDYYLVKMHDFIDVINHEFANFYDIKLLKPISNYLIQKADLNDKYAYTIYVLVENYYKLEAYDENLLKLAIDLVCSNEELRSKINRIKFYFFISKYKFPFVDQAQLTDKLFDAPDLLSKRFDTKNARILSELILNDVNNKKLYHQLCDSIEQDLNRKLLRRLSTNEYKRIKLAKVYLKMFSKLEDNMKIKIEKSLKQIVHLINLRSRPVLSTKYINVNNKLQKNGFLSNGIYIKAFGIYDKNLNDFIDLTSIANYENYFDMNVDGLPLTDNQELVTFVECDRLKGNLSANYYTIYNIQIKKVLKKMNFQTIDVIKEDFSNLKFEKQVSFLLEAAYAYYGQKK